MSDWTYNFDPTSKQEWIDQIEKDLRQQPVDSLTAEWWPGEPLFPLVHPADLEETIVRLPDSLFKRPPLIAEWIAVENLNTKAVNEQILNALDYGAETVILCGATDPTHVHDYLIDVQTDIINLQFDSNQDSIPHLINHHAVLPNDAVIRLHRSADERQNIAALISNVKPSGFDENRLRFVYTFTAEGKWDRNTAQTFEQILTDLNEWQKGGQRIADFFDRCVLKVQSDVHYFKQIVQIRVLNLLWLNLKQHFEIEMTSNNHHLECHIHYETNESPDQFLIGASMLGLAAALSGAGTLCIHSSSDIQVPSFYTRINRNIHHLLYMESQISKGTDPLAGAYAIDLATKVWTRKIWDRLELDQ